MALTLVTELFSVSTEYRASQRLPLGSPEVVVV
jgi:hypothetical protein